MEEDQRLPLNGSLSSHRVSSTWGVDGFRTRLAYPESTDASGNAIARYALTFEEDALGRLWKITGPSMPQEPAPGAGRATSELVRYEYAGAKLWKRRYANGAELRGFEGPGGGASGFLFDGLGRVRGLRTVDSQDESFVVVDFRYGYNRVGELTYEQRLHESYGGLPEQFRTRAYTTDQMGRLVRWREGRLGGGDPVPKDSTDPASVPALPSDGEEWGLDLVGNWDWKKRGADSSAVDDYGAANALNQYPWVEPAGSSGERKQFEYDWLGQLRTDERLGKKFVWDGFGRLTRVRTLNGGLVATYRYDALGRRVEKEVESVVSVPDRRVRVVYDGWRGIEERAVEVGEGGLEREVVRARYGFGVGLDEVLWMDRDVPTSGGEPDPRGGVSDGTIESRFYVHGDFLGSVVALTDDERDVGGRLSVVERFTYRGYGEVSSWEGGWSREAGGYLGSEETVSRYSFPYLFTGQRLDVETGLYYYKNRYYDPASGRFLSRDPIGYLGGANLYDYASGHPERATDPFGLLEQFPGAMTKESIQWIMDGMGFQMGARAAMELFGRAASNLSGGIRRSTSEGAAVGEGADADSGSSEATAWDPELASTPSSGDGLADGALVALCCGPSGATRASPASSSANVKLMKLTEQDLRELGFRYNPESGYWERMGKTGLISIALGPDGTAMFRGIDLLVKLGRQNLGQVPIPPTWDTKHTDVRLREVHPLLAVRIARLINLMYSK